MIQQRAVKALGEIALRVEDLDSMQRFYEEVIGLELMKRFPHAVFFKIAEGYGRHTQILALFDRRQEADYRGVEPEKSGHPVNGEVERGSALSGSQIWFPVRLSI